jgi:hypothetical protein
MLGERRNKMANNIRVRNIDITADTATYELTPANLGLNPALDFDNIQLTVSEGAADSQFQVELRPVGASFYIQPDLGGWDLDVDSNPIKLNCGKDVFLGGPNLGQNGLVFDAIKVTFTGNTEDCVLYCCFIQRD